MKTFGQILVDARNRKGLSLEDAEAATKIRKKILIALEKGDWVALPPSTFLKGLVKNYAKFLDLDPNELLAFYRREFIEKKEHRTPSIPVEKNRLRLTPQIVTVGVVGFFALIVGVYLFVQYQSFTGAPLLELEQPEDNIRVTSSEINLVGRTWDDAILKVNGQEVSLSPGGTFSLSVGLNSGINTITVTAANRFGKISTQKRTIVVDAPVQEPDEPKGSVKLKVRATPESTNLLVEIDGKVEFNGVLVAGSEKEFTGLERIRLVTKNAGATLVTFDGKEEALGKSDEQAEKVYTPADSTTSEKKTD